MMRIVCFHNPEEMNGYLSNGFLSEFEKDGIKFDESKINYQIYHNK